MRRRAFLLAAASVSLSYTQTWAAATAGKVSRIGVLQALPSRTPAMDLQIGALRDGLAARGWREGENLRIEHRWAVEPSALRARARELIGLSCDALVTQTNAATVAALAESKTIPVIFVNVGDAVGSGFVASLARPGGNATGLTDYELTISGKWLGLLKEAAPKTDHAAVLFNPDVNQLYAQRYAVATEVAPSLGLALEQAPVRSVSDISSAIRATAAGPNGGLVVLPEAFLGANSATIISEAANAKLPAIYPFSAFATSGGLMSYGVDIVDEFRQAANFVDRVLRGESPAELPAQQQAKYDLVVNLKTAHAMGLEIPATLLARADQVIE